MKKELICTACPRGCHLTVERSDSDHLSGKDGVAVTGNMCPKGTAYGKQEMICPMRILTTTVACTVNGMRRLPVKTGAEVPLADIQLYRNEIRHFIVDKRTGYGDILGTICIEKYPDVKISVIATASTEEV
ncbi:MAG: DUF1667 domain-containing protein [Treponema sp.]|jgi:CxxC motif-containing protein|nr:DUF1667 domain-containing protein [Treponema sp.]